jgi:hypothetical protein
MAKESSLDPTGALAIRPPRENIFARPRAENDAGERRGPAGIFASTAACPLPDTGTAAAPSCGTTRDRLIGWPTRLVAIAGAVAAFAAMTTRSAPDEASGPSRPETRQSTTSRPSASQSVSRRKPRARVAAKRLNRARRSAAPKRASHGRSAPRTSSPSPVVQTAPAAPVPVPRRRGTGPLPKRVPEGAPPEFM